MKKLLFPLFFLAIGLIQVNAQDEAYTAENEGWTVSLEEAYKESQETGKPIMANFTGSDWCGWCVRLTKSVFSKDEFKTWAADNVVLLELDFPRRKTLPADIQAQNQSLKQAFQIRGFPSVWVFDLARDAEGRYNVSAHGKTGYAPTVGEFTGAVNQMLAQRAEGTNNK